MRKGWSKGRRVWLSLLAAVLLSGCSGGQDQMAAKDALNKSLKREVVSLPLSLGRVGYGCGDIPGLTRETGDLTSLATFHAAQKAGLITITQDGPGFWHVEAVDLKPELRDFLKRTKHNQANGCDSVHLAFAVASKSVAGITGVHKITDEKSEVVFTWDWVLTPAGAKVVNALNEGERRDLNANLEDGQGRTLRRDPSFILADITQSSLPHEAKKTLKKSGNGWAVDE